MGEVAAVKIDRNVPIPTAGRGSKWEAVLRKMNKNDSILFNKEGQASSFLFEGRKNNCKLISRKVEGGIRVWMTKKGIRQHT